jgi:sugar phosphate isomerase/epimerase
MPGVLRDIDRRDERRSRSGGVKLSLLTDSVPELSLQEVLDLAAGLGMDSVEISSGGQSSAPHMRLDELLQSTSARTAFGREITSRGLRLAAINCSAWPLHPIRGPQETRFIQDSIRLAGELGVEKIVTMSGCPGDSPQATTINWIWFPWPPETQPIRERQWEQALELWQGLADFAGAHGVNRIAFELHPLHMVYNVPTLRKLRDAVGPTIGANLDPSHLFWQQMDPVRVIHALGPALFHVHLKDTQLLDEELAINGVLDPRPWEEPTSRSWVFRTVGEGRSPTVWTDFLNALEAIGYDDDLSIENEDPFLPGESGVRRAVEFMSSLMPGLVQSD